MEKSCLKREHLRWYNSFFKSFFLLLLCSISTYGQIGINTTDPKGTLDITTTNNTGLVVPRVSAVENVTDGNGNPPVNGTQVYDISRDAMCYFQDNSWICIGVDGNGNPVITNETTPPTSNYDDNIDYIKSSNNDLFDYFGYSTVLSSDGNTLVVSSFGEASNATGINGNQTDNSLSGSGAVYVYTRTAGIWSQQAYIKASYAAGNRFGADLALSNDGNTLAVGATYEASNATGINGDQTNTSANISGAVYVFNRIGITWSQEAYIKASNTETNDFFGHNVALSSDGNTLAVGAPYEDSNATGINGDQTNNARLNSGAIYIFTRVSTTWSQQAYIKASNSGVGDRFGHDVALSSDGNTLAAGAPGEASNATGINGSQTDNSNASSGAVYIFDRAGAVWSQQAYIKASNAEANDYFGYALAVSDDGNTLAIGAYGEDSNATGINGNQVDNSLNNSGAVYIFTRVSTVWNQQTYIKSSNTDDLDQFGRTVIISGDGNTIATGAVGLLNEAASTGEDSNAMGVDGDQTNNAATRSGAVYVLNWTGTAWEHKAYVKATNTDSEDFFGYSIHLSNDGKTLAVGAIQESSTSTGINGSQADDFGFNNGAVYVYTSN